MDGKIEDPRKKIKKYIVDSIKFDDKANIQAIHFESKEDLLDANYELKYLSNDILIQDHTGVWLVEATRVNSETNLITLSAQE